MEKVKIIKRKRQYIIPLGNGWGVKSEGRASFTFITDNKREAISYAKSAATVSKSDLLIYAKDGKIAERINYSVGKRQITKRSTIKRLVAKK